jgi:peptide-methionine (S)-S-oxide reductase
MDNGKYKTAVFGGGCFWCTEAIFQNLKGVISVKPGYAGGTSENPTYEEVCGGNTGHAEVIKIDFDPEKISYDKLLTVFFATHDPTTINQQGNDVGTQYRSIVFFIEDTQKQTAETFIKKLNDSDPDERPIVTEVKPMGRFYEAEEYHRNFYERNSTKPYCQIIIEPKVKKLFKEFANLLKENSLT